MFGLFCVMKVMDLFVVVMIGEVENVVFVVFIFIKIGVWVLEV